MKNEEAQKFIDSTTFPIHIENTDTPEQLHVLGKESAWYDPVWSMRVDGETLVIVGWLDGEYVHNLEDIASLEVVPYVKD